MCTTTNKHKATSAIALSLIVMIIGTTSVRAQFFGGGDYPRLKLSQLIGGSGGGGGSSSSGLNLNSGLGQVISSLLGSASSSSSASPLQQLATAASTSYINAIRSALPFGQYGGGGAQHQHQHSSYQPHNHQGPMHYGAASQQIFNTLPNPMGLLGAGNEAPNFYGAGGFDSLQGYNPEIDSIASDMYAGGANSGPQHSGADRGNVFGQHHQFQHQFQQQQGGHGFGSQAYTGPGQYGGNVQDMDGKK